MSNDHDAKASPGEQAHALKPEHIRTVRLGHGANCSSVGSVVDMLFVGATVGGAVFAAICAAMHDEADISNADADADDAAAPEKPSAP